MSRNIKYQSNIIHLCDKRKGFGIVDPFLLRESLGDQMSLMAFNNTALGKIGLIHPKFVRCLIEDFKPFHFSMGVMSMIALVGTRFRR